MKKKTEYLKNSANPSWNTKLSFKIDPPAESDVILVRIVDKAKKDSIAETEIQFSQMYKLFKENASDWFALTGKKTKGAKIRLGFTFAL